MANARVDHGEAFTQQHPCRVYPRRPPALFNAASRDLELLGWFYTQISQPTIESPAEGYIYLPECYVFDGRYILDAELNWIEASLADWEVGQDVKTWVQDSLRRTPPAPLNIRGTDWYHVLFAQCNADNYGHFLCEAAPKVANIARAGFRKVRYILPANCAKYETFLHDIFTYFGIAAEPIAVAHAAFVLLKDLLYFTPVSRHNFRKSPTLLEFRAAALARFGAKGGTRHKVFIERSATDRRRISNQDALTALLAAQGYRSVYPGDMSIPDQIEVFSQASHIVGSVGAGLTNMLFAPEESNIFYVCNGLIDFFFWDISGLCGQQFSWFFARPPQRFDQADFVSDFLVDPVELVTALRRSLA